ncbi:MAG: ankyrin repeat domain-containing protein, partial [Armatimonadota bacterium]|nr:ankyrin repeat domain-containing protein [Armatimonadota bacterium]
DHGAQLADSPRDEPVLLIAMRDEPLAELLIARGAPVNSRYHGDTPLTHAIEYGSLNLVTLLIRKGADVNHPDNLWGTPLLTAIQRRRTTLKEVVELLLAAGAKVNDGGGVTYTPLHAAIENREGDVVRLLLQHGADLHARDRDHDTPLRHAIKVGDRGIAESIRAAGGKEEIGPVFDIISAGSVGDLTQYLQDHHPYTPEVDDGGETPLHRAAFWGNPAMTALLLRAGLDPKARSTKGLTPLHHAAQSAVPDVALLLLQRGADINARDATGLTPLHLAAHAGSIEMTEFLLNHGANVQSRDAHGYTPLHIAASARNIPLMTLLLAHGAAVNARDSVGESPLDSAVTGLQEDSRKDAVALLLAHGADPNNQSRDPTNRFRGRRSPLYFAVLCGDLDTTALLLHAGANPNTRGDMGSPLEYAMQWPLGEDKEPDSAHRRAMIKLLFDANADPNVLNRGGQPLLDVLMMGKKTEYAEMLLNRNADVNHLDSWGNSPLRYALDAHLSDLAALIRQRGGKDQQNPIIEAIEDRDVARVGTLLKVNPQLVFTEDTRNRKPIAVAALTGNVQLIQLLLDHGAVPGQIMQMPDPGVYPEAYKLIEQHGGGRVY